MAPPPWTLIPTGPGLLAMPGTALPLTYFDNQKCNLIKHLLVDSGDKGIGMNPLRGMVDWIKTGPGPKAPPWDSGANAKEVARAGMLAGGSGVGDGGRGGGDNGGGGNGGKPGNAMRPPNGGIPPHLFPQNKGGKGNGDAPSGGGSPNGAAPTANSAGGNDSPKSDAAKSNNSLNAPQGNSPSVGGRNNGNPNGALGALALPGSGGVPASSASPSLTATTRPPAPPLEAGTAALGPMKPAYNSHDTLVSECGDCHGTKSIVGKEDKYSYFGPLGPIPLSPRSLPLPNGTPQKNPLQPGSGSGLDWVGDEFKKYTKTPLPKNAELGAVPMTNFPDNLQRQGGHPNGAGPPPGQGGKEAAFPLYGNVVDKMMGAADGGGSPPPMPSGLNLPPPPAGAGGGGCMFCPLLDLINNLPFLPIVPLPDIPAPFMKWPHAPPPPPMPPPPPSPPPADVAPPPEPTQQKTPPKKKDKKANLMDKLKAAAKSLMKMPPSPVELGAAALQAKPNDGSPPTAGGDEGGGEKCGKCPCKDCKPKGPLMTKSIPALQSMCEDPNNFCSKWVCECVKPKSKPKVPMPKVPSIPKLPPLPDGSIPSMCFAFSSYSLSFFFFI